MLSRPLHSAPSKFRRPIATFAFLYLLAAATLWLSYGWVHTVEVDGAGVNRAGQSNAAPATTPACPPPSTGADGPFAPTANTVLPAGIYNFTTINVPPGVVVQTTGSGVLDLRATGDAYIGGTINLSGGTGGSGGTSCSGSGGATGFPTAGGCASGQGGGGGTGFAGQPGSAAESGRGGVFGGGGGGNAGGGGGGYAGGGGGGGPGGTTNASGGNGGGTGGTGGGVGVGGGGGVGGSTTYNGTAGQSSASEGGGGGGGSIGSGAASDLTMSTTFQPGSAGGGGGGLFDTFTGYDYGAGGGGAGGALRIASATQISVTGALRADGGNGGNGFGGGGGGSGGALFLAAPNISFASGAAATARGGIGGAGSSGAGAGGLGGLGRILLSANTLATGGAAFNPPLPPGSNGSGYTYVTTYCLNTPTPLPTGTSTPTGTATRTPTSTPTQAALVVGHVTWQGRAAQPSIMQQLPISLTLKSGSVEVNYPLMLTDPSGFFTVTTSLPNGTYNWRAKGPTFLANAGALTLTGVSPLQVEMGLMRTGDLNGDNVVNSVDFNLLRSNFGFGGAPPLRPTDP